LSWFIDGKKLFVLHSSSEGDALCPALRRSRPDAKNAPEEEKRRDKELDEE
jgi:hypothetical protein